MKIGYLIVLDLCLSYYMAVCFRGCKLYRTRNYTDTKIFSICEMSVNTWRSMSTDSIEVRGGRLL